MKYVVSIDEFSMCGDAKANTFLRRSSGVVGTPFEHYLDGKGVTKNNLLLLALISLPA